MKGERENLFGEVKKKLLDELECLIALHNKVKKALYNAPEFQLRISGSHGRSQYYIRPEGEKGAGKYLRRKELHKAEQIAQKDYDKTLQEKILNRIEILEHILALYPENNLTNVYDELSPERKRLVIPRIFSEEMYAEKWEKVEYVGKKIDEIVPGFYTEKGHAVRSKSEKIIADKLYSLKIPYRYEQPLMLKGFGTVYPDFKALNKRTRKEYYWEHFGKMDDPDYSEKAVKKINTYIKNGIYPGEQLILTYETRNCPLDVKVLEGTIQKFLV